MNKSVNDETLAMKAKNGNHQAFMELYERYLTKVYKRVKSRVPLKDAEDVTQEIFIAVIRSLRNFEQRSLFSTWLFTIVNRQIADYYRRHYRRNENRFVPLELDTQQLEHTSYTHENLDEIALMQQALTLLPENYQDIIMLRFADGLSFREIAERRNQSLEAVKSLYRRALQALQKQMGEN
jgi:RNA polymerase sigma-70 factor (ECF subfamily)